MIDVSTYPVAHGKEKGGGGGVTYITGSVANSDLPDTININTINAANANIDYLTGKSLTYNDGAINYLSSSDANIANIAGNNLNYANGTISHLNADEITTGKITAKEAEIEKAWIEILNSKNITTEYLTVTKQAHFFELIIDKIKSVGGTIIETAANCIVDKVKAYSVKTTPVNHDISEYEVPLTANNILSYGIFFRSKNDNGRQISNDWLANDQAICQSFNATEGVSHNVANKYYWRLVTEKLEERYMNLKTGEELEIDTANPPVSSEAVVQFNNDAYLFRVTYTTYDSNGDPVESTVKDGWTISPQTVDNIPQAQWDNTNKKMTTTSTAFGIKLVADNSAQVYDDQTQTISNITVGNVIPTKFEFKCTAAARLNVGVIYTDSTSQWFPAPAEARDSYVDDGTNNYAIHLNSNNTISMIVITNAEEGDWQTVHGILLSNDLNASPKEVDDTVTNQQQYSAPSEGDNLAQLGYRGQDDPSRSSAIIIAAYKTPDSGIKPPSYAQYRNITDFNLTSHRQTYFDANGAKFVGDFEIAGQDIQTYIDGQISSTAPTYYLYTAYCDFVDGDPTHKDPTLYPNNVIHFSLSYDQNQAYMGIWSTTVSQQPTNPDSAVNYEWMYIQGSQGQQGPAGPTGAPGSHIEFAYKNATNNPLQNGATTPLNTYPSGFATAVTSPPTGQATWMTQSVWGVQGATYLTWNPAIRITGDKGNPGEDGTEIEFIYTRNNGNNGSPNPPAAPPSTFDPGPTGATYNGVYWTNHPVGVAEATMYEYVCQRIKGPTGVWGAYQPSPAAVWSKWGVKGQDGDGYEYIYKAGATYGQLPSTIVYDKDGNLRTQEYIQTHDDFVPMGWYDEPVTLSATSGPEWVSTRKKEDGSWGAFSEPKVWAHWAEPGSVGPTGPQGPTGPAGPEGENAIQYKIIDVGSYANISATLSDDPNVTDPALTLSMSLSYRVAKIVGITAAYMTQSELNTLGVNVYYKMSKVENTAAPANPMYYKMTLSDNNGSGLFTAVINSSNQKIVNDNKSIDISLLKSTANSLAITAEDAKKNYDTQLIIPVMNSAATFQVMQGDHARISMLVTGTGVTAGTTTNLMTLINQNASAITLKASQEDVNTGFNNVNGQITNIQDSIAQINLNATAIASTVSNLNAGTKNYFNFTFTTFDHAVPFIQGYGIEGTGSSSSNISQINNLGFDGIGGDFSVTCWMRMKQFKKFIKVALCDTDPSNIERSDNQVEVTTNWQYYKFTYKNIPTNKVNLENGHIVFTSDTANAINDTNRIVVKNLMITRGNVPADFNISWKDYESVMTRNEALIVADNEWTYNNMTETAEQFKGFKVWRYNGTSTLYDTKAYKDFIAISGLPTKQHKIYTLSFYAKLDSKQEYYTYPELRSVYMYNNGGCVNSDLGIDVQPKQISTNYNIGQPSIGNNNDGYTTFMLNGAATSDNYWQQFIIHWYNNNAGNRDVIAMRARKPNSDDYTGNENPPINYNYPRAFSVAGVELREGWWDVDGVNSTSLIKQTADEIELKVKKTGINIDDGTITLTADKTTINGGFQLYGGDQGLGIYNASGNEKISIFPDNIKGLSSYNVPDNKVTTYDHSANRIGYEYITNDAGTYAGATAVLIDTTVAFPTITIGSVEAGGTIHINALTIRPTDNHNASAVLPTVNYSWKLYVNGNQISTSSSDATMSGIAVYNFPPFERQSPSASGTVTFKMTLTFSSSDPSKWNSYEMKVWSETVTSTLSKIGQDGAVFGYNKDNFAWIGPTQTVISHGNSNTGTTAPYVRQLIVDESGIYNSGADIGGYMNVKVINSSTNLDLKDTFVLINDYSNDITINIPDRRSCIGKVYYFRIKNPGTRNVKVNEGNNGQFLMKGNTRFETELNLKDNGQSTQMIVATSSGWIHGVL